MLLDRADFCSGASGSNHGMLHSGARYAVKDPESAKECASEANILRKIAAPFIEDTGGLFAHRLHHPEATIPGIDDDVSLPGGR